MSLAVDLNGKGPTKVNGTLRMKRDEVIQLSIAPFLGIEVARAEISPDGVLVMDRMNKRYVQVPFDELKNLAKADLDFHTLQALFMNEIFLPGKKVLTVRDISSFAVRPENENALIEVKNGKHFAYRFRTNTNDGLLKESHIGLSGTRYGINWRYDMFRPLEQKQFPASMTVSFEGAKQPVTAVFELSRLSTNKDWESHTEVPQKYEKIELQDLLKQLIMKRIFLLLIACCFLSTLLAQSTRKIRELEAKRKELHQQIAESETLLQFTKKDVKSQLDNLALLTGQIEERRKYINTIESDVHILTSEIASLQKQLNKLQRDLKDKKQKYEISVQYMYRNKSVQEKLMFIFSAENLSQTYRRMRYVQEYANFQRLQGMEIERKQKQIAAKKREVEQTKNAKQNLLKQGEAEKIKLEIQEKERQTLLANLQKKQKGIQNEIRKKKRSAEQLNAQIDRLIEIEIEKARKRAEEEARRKAAAEAAAKAAAAKKAENKTTGGVTRSKSTEKNEDTRKAAPVEKFSLNNEDRQLSGSFERNRGILPVPITGPYVIVSHYGQYAVDGLRNVKLDNKGIDIKGKPGAQARAVFDGEVSAIFQYNGLNNILVRHGNYISVYCNLSSVSVSKGSKVNTRTVLGTIHTDSSGNTVLHFQLRKETAKLNPELWLGR